VGIFTFADVVMSRDIHSLDQANILWLVRRIRINSTWISIRDNSGIFVNKASLLVNDISSKLLELFRALSNIQVNGANHCV
jgi:hypothetical protein